MRRFRLVAAPAAALALIITSGSAHAKTPLPAQCPDGRFLVQGTPLIAGSTTPTLEAVTLGTSVAITTGCPTVTGKVKRTRKGTVLTASWRSCPGLSGRVKLKALVAAPACGVMTGTLTASKAKPKKHPFTAARSYCGDMIVDPDAAGEQCDGAGTCASDHLCTNTCQCVPLATTTSTSIVAGTTSTTSTSPVPTTTVTTTPTTTTPTTTTPTTSVPTTTLVSTTTTTSTTLPAAPAVLEMTEIEPNLTGNQDLIELRVVSTGTCAGIAIEQAGFGSPITLAALPDVVVAAGDLIVVHLNPPAGGGDPPASETTSPSQFAAAVFPANYDGAWDFLGSPSGVAFGTRIIQLRVPDTVEPAGRLVEAVPFVKQPYNPPSGFVTALQGIQALGLWLPADCGGVPCTDVSTPAAKEIATDWTAVGNIPSGDSVARHAGASTPQASDWAVGPSTMGAPNL